MKQFIFPLLVLSSILLVTNSCDKNNPDPGPTEVVTNSTNGIIVTDYCSEADDWVVNNYPDETIDSVLLISTQGQQGGEIEAYEVHISNGAIVFFDAETCAFLYDLPPCGCSGLYDPVCWDGETYDSECLAVCAGADPSEVSSGACGPCGCSSDFAPVCWNDTEYDNECLAVCAGAEVGEITPGSCPSGGNCIEDGLADISATAVIVSVIEGYGNVQYGNAYYAVTVDIDGAELVIHFDEDCNYYTFCGCAADLAIVCANGTNYLNTCAAECDGNAVADITVGPC